MNRLEFLRRLEYLLSGIPESERMDALAYYNNYFDEAGVENEQKVIWELGTPEQVARMILADFEGGNYGASCDYGSSEENTKPMRYEEYQESRSDYEHASQSRKKLSGGMIILLILLAVLTCPVWIGILVGILGGVVGILGGLFGVTVGLGGAGIGMFVGSLVCIGSGIFSVFAAPAEGFAVIGVGAILLAISILFILLCVLLVFYWLPMLVKAIIKWVKGLRRHQERGNEA